MDSRIPTDVATAQGLPGVAPGLLAAPLTPELVRPVLHEETALTLTTPDCGPSRMSSAAREQLGWPA